MEKNLPIEQNKIHSLPIPFCEKTSLTEPQKNQVVLAIKAGAYDMASEYVWKRAITRLKETISVLGVDFIANLLQRTDIDDYTPLDSILTDYTTIKLAEQLGMISYRSAMKLRQAYELIQYFFSSNSQESGDQLKMTEALSIISDCVEYILNVPNISIDVEFSRLQERLITEDIKAKDIQIEKLKSSSLFFIRTVCTILSTAIRKEQGAELEHSVNNFTMLLPLVWDKLGKDEKWNIGSLYRDVVSAGNTKAATGVKLALSSVHGFDFVPESLRSNTFINVARNLIDVHFGYDNYYREPKAVRELSKLGSFIPDPAFSECVKAYLLVYIGNFYGYSHEGAPLAFEELEKISNIKWSEYFNDYFPTDIELLQALLSDKPLSRFNAFWQALKLQDLMGDIGKGRYVLGLVLKKDKLGLQKYIDKVFG